MFFEKRRTANKYTIMTDVNVSTLDVIEKLYREAKQDFPGIKRSEVGLVIANKQVCGIEIEIQSPRL